MISDRHTLVASGLFMAFFLLCGIIGILDNPVIKFLLLIGFLVIVVKIILEKSKDGPKKNPPD